MANYIRITLTERQQISALLEMKVSINKIANKLGRYPSTIGREIDRNSVEGKYQAYPAHKAAKERHPCPPNKMDVNKRLYECVVTNLRRGWSPSQISGWLKNKKKNIYICAESIYRYFYNNKENKVYELFPSKRNHRFRRARKARKPQKNPSIHSIEHRPKHVEKRTILGHWEGDTIRFNRQQKACVTTLVERVSRLVYLFKNENGTSQHVMGHIEKALKASTRKVWRTITFDNGTEFKHFKPLEKAGCRIYFSHPYSPWERGTNENTNGRIRRTLGRSTKMNEISQADLDELAKRLNNTPRKCLNYQTPIEVFKRRVKRIRCNGL